MNFAKQFGMEGSKITNHHTYYKVLEDLERFNIIKYTAGKNRFSFPILELVFDNESELLLSRYRAAITLKAEKVEGQTALATAPLLPSLQPLYSPRYSPSIALATAPYIHDNKIIRLEDTTTHEENEKVVVEEEEKIQFIEFWKAYQKPTGDRILTQSIWDSLSVSEQKIIIEGLPAFLSLPDNSKDGRRYQPNASSFLRNKRWEEASYIPTKEQKAQDDLQRICVVGYPYGQLEMTYADYLAKIQNLPEHNKNYFTFKNFIA